MERIKANGKDNAYICNANEAEMLQRAKYLDEQLQSDPEAALARFPLLGLPFSVKDNIDVKGYPTTAGCPGFSYNPERHATSVHNILDAGGIFVGKTNMDQFATGLVGVRTPYGTPVNPLNKEYVPGGSSSGAGVSVSKGTCSFGLGTDTAGSGRIPAAFNNIVGMKPSLGLVSTTGLVPACRTLDVISVFALTVNDSWRVFERMRGYDPTDIYSRTPPSDQSWLQRFRKSFKGDGKLEEFDTTKLESLRIGIPHPDHLKLFGKHAGEALNLFHKGVQRLTGLVHSVQEIDLFCFTEVAKLLYSGAWVAERFAGNEAFLRRSPQTLLPITREIIERSGSFTAVDAFQSLYHRDRMRRLIQPTWQSVDLIVVPTASITPTIEEVIHTRTLPNRINTDLGYYTNFVNLLDLCALAVPNGYLSCGVGSGLTLVAPAFNDYMLASLGSAFQQVTNLPLGATKHLPPKDPLPKYQTAHSMAYHHTQDGGHTEIAVVGAHLSGMPLNHQLTSLSATLVESTKTSPKYRLYSLNRSALNLPDVPGLLRVSEDQESKGSAIELEVWSLPSDKVGSFLANVGIPLSIGNVELANGKYVKGFLCEPYVTQKNQKIGAEDISKFGGWRAYTRSKSSK